MSTRVKRSAGFTLIELLVGVTLGLLIVGVALMFFVSNKQHFLVQLDATRLQENKRFAVHFLTRDIQGAGYRGCAGGSDGPLLNLLNNSANLENDFLTGIEGFNDVSATLPADLTAAGVAPHTGTDVLVVRGPRDDSSAVSTVSSDTQVFAAVTLQETGACADGTNRVNGICGGDYLLISDCQKARIFQAGTVGATGTITHPQSTGKSPGNCVGTWTGAGTQFDTDSEIVPYSTDIYFIADGFSGEPALFRKTNTDAALELVEGVEDLQIEYLESTENAYGDADSTDWDNVVAVRIWFLLRGFEDNMAAGTQSYPLIDGSAATASDTRLRTTAVATASLRNRLP